MGHLPSVYFARKLATSLRNNFLWQQKRLGRFLLFFQKQQH